METTSFDKEFIVTDESVIKELIEEGAEICRDIEGKLSEVDLKILQKRALSVSKGKIKEGLGEDYFLTASDWEDGTLGRDEGFVTTFTLPEELVQRMLKVAKGKIEQ